VANVRRKSDVSHLQQFYRHTIKCTAWGITRWCSWLTHCATSPKVAYSITDAVNGIFHWHNPSGRTMDLGSTQPLKEMSSRYTSWGVKSAGAWGWQSYQLQVPTVLKSGILNFLEHSGLSRAALGLLYVLQDTRSLHDFNNTLWHVRVSRQEHGLLECETV